MVENYFLEGFGGFSGGTAASLFDIMETTPQDILDDPKMLCPEYFKYDFILDSPLVSSSLVSVLVRHSQVLSIMKISRLG